VHKARCAVHLVTVQCVQVFHTLSVIEVPVWPPSPQKRLLCDLFNWLQSADWHLSTHRGTNLCSQVRDGTSFDNWNFPLMRRAASSVN